MSKTITIPADRGNPVFVTVNGRKYSYPAGTQQTVPDEVAALLAANEAANVIYGRVPAGPLSVGDKFSGEDAIPVTATLGGRLVVDAADVVEVATPLVTDAVDDWLDDHPEATTTVEDGAITRAKLHEDMKNTTDLAVNGFAAAFDSTESYSKGDYVTYGGKVYIFKTTHAAGAWDADDVTEVKVTGEINNLKSESAATNTKLKDETLDTHNELLPYNAVWEAGNISSSTGKNNNSTSTTRIRCANYYAAYSGMQVSIPNGYKALGFRYSGADYSYFLGTLNGGFWMRGDWFLQDAAYYRFVLANEDDTTTIATSAGANVTLTPIVSNRFFDYSVDVNLENGSFFVDYGTTGNGYANIFAYRRTDRMIEVTGGVTHLMEISSDDVSALAGYSVYEYGVTDGEIVFLRRKTPVTTVRKMDLVVPSADAKYIKISFSTNTGYEHHAFKPVRIHSRTPLRLCKNPNLYNTTEKIIYLLYNITGDVFTSGQLMLPPNYSIDGNQVPLLVYCHGTDGCDKWDRKMTLMGDIDLQAEFDYWISEGFAVFDCYPWTTKYYSTSSQISPFMVAPNVRAYVEGIKYVCDRYNVDIGSVCVSGLSLGGNMATWFAFQTEIPVKAVALMAPTTGWISQRWKDYFLAKSARNRIVEILGLSEETDASTFINTDNGIHTAAVNQFVVDHLDSFAGLSPAALGATGSTYLEQYTWAYEMETTLPEWMSDLDIPDIPEGWLENTYGDEIGVPKLVDHPELTKFSPYPVKFWQAFDDVNVSGHANYTIYTWMKNGGTKAYWRTLPNDCGGHGATGYGQLAPKTSGTTHLGTAFTDVPVAQVEMIDFFYDQING